MKTLPKGKHKVKIIFENGYAETEIVIKEKNDDNEENLKDINKDNKTTEDLIKGNDKTPRTGDPNKILTYIALAIVSIGGIMYIRNRMKKFYNL